jgi:TatD DNase family protein
MIIDTHSHIYSEDFEKDLDEVLERAKVEGVRKILMPNIDKDSFASMIKLELKHPKLLKSMIGVHPTSVSRNVEFYKDWLLQNYSDSFVAIGETGIDLYWDKSYLQEQIELLIFQIEMALEYKKPVVLHVRDAFEDIFMVLKKYKNTGLKGVFHCFSGGKEEARKVLDLGFLLGIGGVVTYKNSDLPEVISEFGIEKLLLETDSPYLSPVPKRGKRNESSYLKYIIEKIHEISGRDKKEIVSITGDNALDMFGL